MSGALVSQPGPSSPNIQPSKEEADAEPPYPGAACVICLNQELNDPTILDCCQHMFCYECINQWLLTNPSCPMCKKHLNKIKHELHPVPQAFPVQYNAVDGNEQTVEDLLSDYEMGFLREQPSPMNQERRCIEDRLEQLYHRTIRLRSLTGEADISTQEIEQKRTALNEEIKDLTQLKTLIMNRARRHVIFNTATFRRLIYSANLAPRSRLAPRFPADISPHGVTTNEALFRRRLIPFLIRELTAIIERSTIDMSRFLELVMEYLMTTRRNVRQTVINKLQNSGVAHPVQFLSNVSVFLSSGQRMEVYDENCEYRSRGSGGEIRALFPQEDDIEFLDETITIPGGNGGFTRRHRAMDNWAENMRMDYYGSIANNPPAPTTPPPLIVIDDGPNNEPDIDFFRIRHHPRRRGNNQGIRAYLPVDPDNDGIEVLNETVTIPGGGDNSFRHPMGQWQNPRRNRIFSSFANENNPSSPVPPQPQVQVITIDANNDSDVEVVSQTAAETSSDPAPKRPRLDTPDLH